MLQHGIINLSLWLICWLNNDKGMFNRNSRGYPYLEVRGEILGFSKDEQLRKHLSRMFSLIKNESLGIEDD